MTIENTELQPYRQPENKLARVSMSELKELGELFFTSGQFADVESAAVAMIKVLAGQEYGFAPITSMSNVHMINGKPVLSATAQASLIKTSGKYNFRVLEHTNRICKLQLYRKGTDGSWEKLAIEQFTWAEADAAGLTTGKNGHTWKKFPRNMLFARAVTNSLRWHFADLLRGEIGDVDAAELAEIPEDLPDEPEIVDEPAEEPPTIEGEIVEEEPAVAPAEAPPAIDKEESRLADLRTAANEELMAYAIGDTEEAEKILKGRVIDKMPAEALESLIREIRELQEK